MTEQNKKLIELMKHIGVVDEKVLQEKLKKAYYEGEPIITDAEYDELFPNDYVGYTPEQNGPWEVLEHKIEMGSLNKLKTWVEAENWLKDKKDVVWEPKLDGLSMELVYEKGTLVHAILRGGGDKGEDILKNAIRFTGVLPVISNETSDYVSIRGEVVISNSNFEELLIQSSESYSNRRNCVPGICRRYDGKYSNFLSFYAYDIIEDGTEFTSEIQKIQHIFDYGFKLPFVLKDMNEAQYNAYGDIRDTAEEFQMDGLVIKTLDMSEQIALKFEPKGEQTVVTGYSWEIGSSGKYVPTILFETVNVGGSNLSKAAIGSFQGYVDLGATVGSIVEVRKMGDVIPKVTRVIKQNMDKVLEIPLVCPKCGKTLERQGSDLYCVNPECPVKVKNKCCGVYWAIAIKGVTSGWLEKLIDDGQISHPHQVLWVTAEDIVSTGGFSQNRAEWVIEEMHKKWKEIIDDDLLEHLLWMLPIPTVSNAAYEKIKDYFTGNIENFEKYLSEELNEQDKNSLTNLLGNAKGTKTFNYFRENREDILRLVEEMRKIK